MSRVLGTTATSGRAAMIRMMLPVAVASAFLNNVSPDGQNTQDATVQLPSSATQGFKLMTDGADGCPNLGLNAVGDLGTACEAWPYGDCGPIQEVSSVEGASGPPTSFATRRQPLSMTQQCVCVSVCGDLHCRHPLWR